MGTLLKAVFSQRKGPQISGANTIYLNFKFSGKWMLNPQEGGRLDAKRHYVILAKALDGIWPVGHACAVLC